MKPQKILQEIQQEHEANFEKKQLEKMNEDMYCNKYDEFCLDVPYEVLMFIGGFGFSNYDCNLDCNNCEHMEEC